MTLYGGINDTNPVSLYAQVKDPSTKPDASVNIHSYTWSIKPLNSANTASINGSGESCTATIEGNGLYQITCTHTDTWIKIIIAVFVVIVQTGTIIETTSVNIASWNELNKDDIIQSNRGIRAKDWNDFYDTVGISSDYFVSANGIITADSFNRIANEIKTTTVTVKKDDLITAQIFKDLAVAYNKVSEHYCIENANNNNYSTSDEEAETNQQKTQYNSQEEVDDAIDKIGTDNNVTIDKDKIIKQTSEENESDGGDDAS